MLFSLFIDFISFQAKWFNTYRGIVLLTKESDLFNNHQNRSWIFSGHPAENERITNIKHLLLIF